MTTTPITDAAKLAADRDQLTYTLRSLIHTVEVVDCDERFRAREEGRAAQVHTSAIKQAEEALANHGSKT